MSIAILYDRAESDELGIKLAAEERGINIQYLPFRKISISNNQGRCNYKSKGKDYSKIFEDVHVVLNRTQSKNRRLIAANILEAFGKKVLNSSQIEFVCFSKLRTLLAFWKSNIETPKGVYVPCDPREMALYGTPIFNEKDIADLVQNQLGFHNIVIKPDLGTHGRDVTLAETREDLVSTLKQITPSIINPIGVFAQEFIHKWFFDLRIIVYKECGKSPFCYSKAMARAGLTDFRTNASLGNMIFGVNLPLYVQKRAINCAKAIGQPTSSWVLALDAMINFGEFNSLSDSEINFELKKLRPYFSELTKVKSSSDKKKNFLRWNRRLENAFQEYQASQSYEKIRDIIEDSVEEHQSSLLFNEVNSCPEFWENTRLATGINLAVPLIDCAKSIESTKTNFSVNAN